MRYIGIDPGVSGGIVALSDGGTIALAEPMPETERDILEVIKSASECFEAVAVIEQVAAFAMPGRSMGASSAMTFGKNVGHLEMALVAAGIPFDRVVPR